MIFKPAIQRLQSAAAVVAMAIGAAVLPCAAQTPAADVEAQSAGNPLANSSAGALSDQSASESLSKSIGPAPLLEEISRQSQALHAYVSTGIVRVHLPDRSAVEISPAEELLRKWEQRLEPAVREKLIEQAAALRAMQKSMIEEDLFAAARASAERLSGAVLMVHPFDPIDLTQQMPLNMMNAPRPHAPAPGTLGVVMDDHGLVLVPSYVDRELGSQRPMRVALPEGSMGEAVFVGSDRSTGLTLVRLSIPAGRPVRFAVARPQEGSLVMTFATQSNTARLAVWTVGMHDAGLVVTPDGRVAGFANANQFLSVGAAGNVIKQLAVHGVVHRAVLGIRVSEFRHDDPLRQQLAGLGSLPAMRVEKILAGSPADRAGMRPNDLILSIAGDPVGDVPSFAAAIADRTGETEVKVFRAGQVIPLNVALVQK